MNQELCHRLLDMLDNEERRIKAANLIEGYGGGSPGLPAATSAAPPAPMPTMTPPSTMTPPPTGSMNPVGMNNMTMANPAGAVNNAAMNPVPSPGTMAPSSPALSAPKLGHSYFDVPMYKESVIRREGTQHVLYSHKGKVLGRHDSKAKALKQEQAIQIAKHSSAREEAYAKLSAIADGDNPISMFADAVTKKPARRRRSSDRKPYENFVSWSTPIDSANAQQNTSGYKLVFPGNNKTAAEGYYDFGAYLSGAHVKEARWGSFISGGIKGLKAGFKGLGGKAKGFMSKVNPSTKTLPGQQPSTLGRAWDKTKMYGGMAVGALGLGSAATDAQRIAQGSELTPQRIQQIRGY